MVLINKHRERKSWKPIVVRRLCVLGSPRRVVRIEIAQPRELSGCWCCAYRIRGAGLRIDFRAFGEDGLQALLLTFVAVRAQLDTCGQPLVWTGDQHGDRAGDVGIPLQAPMHLGFETQRRIERICQRAVAREEKRRKGKRSG